MKIDPQQALFTEIRSKIGSNRSLVNEIADLLEVSTDSAYRRIRNEKQLTLNELSVLAEKFGISLDNLMHIKSGTLLFNYQTLDKENPQYIQFLKAVYHDLNYLNSIED